MYAVGSGYCSLCKSWDFSGGPCRYCFPPKEGPRGPSDGGPDVEEGCAQQSRVSVCQGSQTLPEGGPGVRPRNAN